MGIRTFSKDGDLEFYQKEHFIAMTGDGAGFYRLESFDTPEMKELLSRKCEKREEWKGVCKGVNGLSTMTDRDVVEKASNAKNGDKFKRLYAGEDLQNNHSNSDMSLMNLLAYRADFGSEDYAMEELRAEIVAIFMEQDLGVEPSEGRLQNNAAYIQSWKEEIKENPNALFTAITDADNIAKYVSGKEQAYRQTKDIQFYAIVEETNAYSEQVYKCC